MSDAERALNLQGRIEGDVLLGQDGQLFLAQGAHFTLDYATGVRSPAPSSYANFADNITERRRSAAEFDATYLHVIFPDKQSVSRYDFPFLSPICLGEQLLARTGIDEANVYYPLETLRASRAPVYFQTDTHLTDGGLIVVATEIVKRLTSHDARADAEALLGKLTDIRDFSGDLGSKLAPARFEQARFMAIDWRLHHFTNRPPGNNGLVDVWFSPNSVLPARLLLFGDSFGRGLARVLTRYFREILFIRTQYYHDDLVRQMRPDCVITSNVERYLANVAPDSHRPCFHMYPYLGDDPERAAPPQAFAEAFSAILSYDRKPYHDFVTKLSGQ